MSPPRYPSAEPLVGSGDIDIEGPAGGQVIRDLRGRGFWARIMAQPDATKSAYGFIRCDDFDPTVALPALTGAIEQGDGTTLAAYEVSGSTSVPTDGTAIVWCEPLRGKAGYGFRHATSSSSLLSGQSTLTGDYLLTSSGFNPIESISLTIDLPSSGTYLIFGHITIEASVSALTAGTGAGIEAYLVSTSGLVLFNVNVISVQNVCSLIRGTAPFSVLHSASGPDTMGVTVACWNTVGPGFANVTWTSRAVKSGKALNGDFSTCLGYIKLA